MYWRCTVNGTCGGGGGTRVISLGGAVRTGATGDTLSDIGVVLETGGGVRTVLGASLAAANEVCGLTSGGLTGFPGNAARNDGFTLGCGTICARSSCCGVSLTICRATGAPLRSTLAGTAVVAIER
jgi:hypothetical protein